MLGAIIGDTAGSVYEFDNIKTTDFPFFNNRSEFTDDSLMSFAVADWLLHDSDHTHPALEEAMVRIAHEFPNPIGGYGVVFTDGCSADGNASPTTHGATARPCA